MVFVEFPKRRLRVTPGNCVGFTKICQIFVTCNTEGCKNSYSSVCVLVRHVSRMHKNVHLDTIDPVNDGTLTAEYNDSLSDAVSVRSNDTGSEPTLASDSCRTSIEEMVNSFDTHATLCILKLHEKHILPATVQHDIIAEMQQMVSQIHETYKLIFDNFCEERHREHVCYGNGQLLVKR